MCENIEKKLKAIAKKLPYGTSEEKKEIAKEINLLAELLIDLKEEHDEDKEGCGLYSGFIG